MDYGVEAFGRVQTDRKREVAEAILELSSSGFFDDLLNQAQQKMLNLARSLEPASEQLKFEAVELRTVESIIRSIRSVIEDED